MNIFSTDLCFPKTIPNSNFKEKNSLSASFNESLEVICDEGFQGGGTVTCQENRFFTSLPTCSPVTCNMEVENGRTLNLTYSSIERERRATIMCN